MADDKNSEISINIAPPDAHNGKQISLVSVSPSGTYVVSYSSEDNSIEGWIVIDEDDYGSNNSEDKSIEGRIVNEKVDGPKWIQLKRDSEATKKLPKKSTIVSIKVNDDKMVFCNENDDHYHIFQISNTQLIKLNLPKRYYYYYNFYHGHFEKNGDLVKLITNNYLGKSRMLIYSLHNGKLNLNSSYELFCKIMMVTIEDNKIWVISSNYLFQLDLKTFQLEFSYSLGFKITQSTNPEYITIRPKENLILVTSNNKIVIFLSGIHFPFRQIQINGSNIKAEFLSDNYLLVFNLPEEGEKQDISLYNITEFNRQPIDAPKIFNDNENDKFILYDYNSKSKKAFGLVDGTISCMNLSNFNWNKFFEFNYDYRHYKEEIDSWNTYLYDKHYEEKKEEIDDLNICLYQTPHHNDTFAFPDVENIRSLINNGIHFYNYYDYHKEKLVDIYFNDQKYKWQIDWKKLSVCKPSLEKNDVLCSKKLPETISCCCNILNNNALLVSYNDKSYHEVYEYDIDNNKITDHKNIDIDFNDQQYKWRICWESDRNLKLSVCSSETNEICSKNSINSNDCRGFNILNNNALILYDSNYEITIYEYNNNEITDHENTDIDFNDQKYKWGIDWKNTDIDFNDQKYKWGIDWKNKKLSVHKFSPKTNEKKLPSKDLKCLPYNWKILNNNALALLSVSVFTATLTIFQYDINDNSIKIKYKCPDPYFKKFSRTTLADNKELNSLKYKVIMKNFGSTSERSEWHEWLESIIEDDGCFAEYGSTLLPILINQKSTIYVESIYNKCIQLVKEDPKRNLKFLNVITSSMKDLYETYPDYIKKFNSEMFMFLDPFNEEVSMGSYHHFTTYSQEIDIYKLRFFNFFQDTIKNSLHSLHKTAKRPVVLVILIFLHVLIACILSGSIGFVITSSTQLNDPFRLLFLIISILFIFTPYSLYFLINLRDSINDNSKTKQHIILILPYTNCSCYPLDYSWWKEIFRPQSSVFTNTCKKVFYTNWNSEAIIHFKWDKFAKYYYYAIWLKFMIFLVCFTIASYPTNSSMAQEIRIKLYQTSIAFGFLHLTFELRQFIWDPKNYFFSIWNWFDSSAYLFAIMTSIYWIVHNDVPGWALSISCLLLDLKFLFFLRIFESFGVYFAIIFGVAKRVFSFLVVLAIIIASFAHAFFLLLHPQNLIDSVNTPDPNDPNNPWTLSDTFNQVDENGTILNETLIKQPDANTNLFYSYPTSLLAMSLFLTGNQNSLSPWTPVSATENTILFILMVLFSFLVVVYLMNLFIGLLNSAMEKDNDRASYLAQKAEIIAEIELFYLLPYQRRRRTWFPEVIYYAVDVEKAREYIKEADNKGYWDKDDWPEMKNKILELLNIKNVIKGDSDKTLSLSSDVTCFTNPENR